MRRKLAAGNWKMNGMSASLAEAGEIFAGAAGVACDVLLCPPLTLLPGMAAAARGSGAHVGAQDCHHAVAGAHTGDVSAPMLAEAGASHVIVGHSERRREHGESSELVRRKAEACIGAGLAAIVCVGETREERDAGAATETVALQVGESLPAEAPADRLVVAYEPVWAIGTGLVPSVEEISEMHDHVRALLVRSHGRETGGAIRILYGGSLTAGSAAGIFAVDNVDGGLVGGASLRARDFVPIIEALDASPGNR